MDVCNGIQFTTDTNSNPQPLSQQASALPSERLEAHKKMRSCKNWFNKSYTEQ